MTTKRFVKLPYLKDKNGHHLCRWCGKRVPKGRIWWCGDDCVQQYRETNDSKYIKRQIRKRDKGICQVCGMNTVREKKELEQRLSQMTLQERHLELDSLGIRKRWPCKLWEAHHVKAVVDGGGGCDYTGYQTLCIWCHKKETQSLMKKLAEKNKAKKMLSEQKKTRRKKSPPRRKKRNVKRS